MSLYTAAGIGGNWLGDWTVFYWAWWMSWAPFVALFIARISKGGPFLYQFLDNLSTLE
jgi:choline/glycine/proline betaine transport protein/glycine betaine transporter